MNNEMNTTIVTVIGLGVVMATLIALWFITRVVSFLVQAATARKASPVLPATDARAEKEISSDSHPTSRQDLNDSELIAVITAAATTVFGARVKVLSCVEEKKVQNNGWILSSRNEQIQSFSNRLNRR